MTVAPAAVESKRDQTADGTASDDMGAVTKGQSRSSYRAYRDRHGLDQRGGYKINICRQRVDAVFGYDGAGRDGPRIVDPNKGERAADVGTARQARLAYAAVHNRIDEDGLA